MGCNSNCIWEYIGRFYCLFEQKYIEGKRVIFSIDLGFPACGQSSRQPSRSLPTGTRIHPGAREPSAPPVPGSPGSISSSCSLLHPLKKWSLRQTRGGSARPETTPGGSAVSSVGSVKGHWGVSPRGGSVDSPENPPIYPRMAMDKIPRLRMKYKR